MRRAMWIAIVAVTVTMPSATAATVNVNVGPGFSFSPANTTVAAGDTIVWTFLSTHSTTSDSQTAAEAWDSGIRSSGTFSHTFTVPGTYPYYCSLHSFPGGTFMNGSVQVTAVVAPVSITTVAPVSALPGAMITITGAGFQSGATVMFRGTASPGVTFVNATTLQAVVPNIVTGAATIVVTNPDTGTASFTGFAVTSLAIPTLSRELLLLLAAALATVIAIRAR